MRLAFYIFLLSILIISCEKYEVTTVHNNQPSNDETLTIAQKENYINRLYISLLGRKADSSEFYSSYQQLELNPTDQKNRTEVVTQIMGNKDFYHKIWEDVRAHVLDGADTSEIRSEYDQLIVKYNNASPSIKPYYQEQIDRMIPILDIPTQLENDNLDLQGVNMLAVNTPIYDQINMGTENFVVSVFQNYLYRFPTAVELYESKRMVNNYQAILFLKAGQGKPSFIDIFFNDHSYYEGQVLYLFNHHLYRNPTTEELIHFSISYIDHKDYKQMILDVLSDDAYFRL